MFPDSNDPFVGIFKKSQILIVLKQNANKNYNKKKTKNIIENTKRKMELKKQIKKWF